MATTKPVNKTSERNYDLTCYLVFPDYWKKSWGERPFLGVVFAVDEFEGSRRAYENGLLPMNYTFGPKLVKSNNQSRGRDYRRQHAKK